MQSFTSDDSIKHNLILTALNSMNRKIDDKVSVPKALEQNKYIWCRAMFRTKPMQHLLNSFTH